MNNSQNSIKNDFNLEHYILNTKEKLESKKTENEIEVKVFLYDDNHSREYIENHNIELQNKILNELDWEIIFDGNIKDTRYYDSKNYNESKLKKQGIDVVRIREQTDYKSGNQKWEVKNIYTVKSIDENKNSLEYEKEVDKNYVEKLENYWLKEIKKSEKTRKEIKFYVYIRKSWKQLSIKKEIKVAFDEYIDEKNKIIKPFFEIESNDEEAIKEAIRVLWIKNDKYKLTKQWPKKLLGQTEKDNTKANIKNVEVEWIINDFKEAIIWLIEKESIHDSVHKFLGENKKDEINIENFEISNAKLEIFIKKLLIKKIKSFISKNKNYIHLFHRILDKDELEKGNIEMWKKFNNKFDREYPWYIKALLKSIKKTFQNNNINWTPNTIFSKIVKDKLNLFLQSLFLFDDSLTKNELEKFLLKSNVTVWTKYEIFDKRVLEMSETIKGKELQKLFLKNSDEKIWHSLLSLYRRAVASIWYEWFQNTKGNKNKEWADQIKENIEKYIGELLQYLSHSFSVWLNSPNRDDETYNWIKDTFLEVFYYIYTFKNSNIAFDELHSKNFNQDFINEWILKYNKLILKESNFIDHKIEQNILNFFLRGITNNITEKNNSKNKIIDSYKKSHDNNITDILLKSKNKEIPKKEKFLNNPKNNINNLEDKDINYKLWNNTDSDLKLKIFFKKILKENKNWYFLNENIIDNSYLNNPDFFKNFINIYFKQKFRIKNIPKLWEKYFSQYEEYTKSTLKQLKNTLQNIWNIKSKNLNILDFIESDVNSFHLLVAWVRFNFKQKEAIEKNVNISTLNLSSLNYSENLIKKLSDDKLLYLDENLEVKNNLWVNFVATTSDWYNSSIFSKKYIDRLFRRVTNWKSINLSTSYSFQTNWVKQFFKNTQNLYIPTFSNWEENINETKKFIDLWLSTVRNILNWEEDNLENKNYYNILKKIWFPLKSEVELKKLLEFLKFIKKETFCVINDIYNNWIEDTKYINENFNTNDFLEKIWISKNDIMIWSAKSEVWLLKKGILKYWWDYVKLWDSTRMTIIQDTVEDLKNVSTNFMAESSKIENVKSIWFEDKIWNLFEKSQKPNWYRDSKLTLTLNNWNTIEVQFQLRDYLKAKHDWIEINEKLQEKMRKNVNFSQEEKEIIIDFCKNTNDTIPWDFKKLFLEEYNINPNLYDNNLLLNADFTYRIERAIWNKSIINKLEEIDRILFDEIAAWKVTRKEIERILKN